MTCWSCLIVTNQNLIEFVVHPVDATIKAFENVGQVFFVHVLLGQPDLDIVNPAIYELYTLGSSFVQLLKAFA